MEEFDLVIIGGGPAGYTGAIRASQLGMKVACVEKRNTLGGTCLNVGCIPSKALLHFSEKYQDLQRHFSTIGILASNIQLDLAKMMNRKQKIVDDLTKGIDALFINNKIKRYIGKAQIHDSDSVKIIDNSDTSSTIKAKNILLATGSEVAHLPTIQIDETRILSSTGALNLTFIPKKMIIIGAGVIGLELGSVWSRLGSEVTVVEYSDRICPFLDIEISTKLKKILENQDINFIMNSKVLSAKNTESTVILTIEDIKSGNKSEMLADTLLVSVGRKPSTNDIGIETVGIEKDNRGFIIVDKNYRTKISNIYAVGDIITGPMLAHKAEEEAIAAVEIMNGQYGHVNYSAIPNVIYTNPEVSSVGATEEELKNSNTPYKIGKFPFLANSRARAIDNTEGFVKILSCTKTDRILGAHIIGKDAGTLIQEVVVAMEFAASSEDLARTCHPHPTLSEAVKEACLAVEKRSINF